MHIIVDIEATCYESPRVQDINEIIEMAIIVCDYKYEILANWNSFVRPKINTRLSNFCKRLTGIRQSDVDSAPYFEEVINSFRKWFSSNFSETLESLDWYSWGKWDENCLSLNCNRNNQPFPFAKHLDLKEIYTKRRNLLTSHGLSIKNVIIEEGLFLEGRFHSAKIDAFAAALIAKKIFN